MDDEARYHHIRQTPVKWFLRCAVGLCTVEHAVPIHIPAVVPLEELDPRDCHIQRCFLRCDQELRLGDRYFVPGLFSLPCPHGYMAFTPNFPANMRREAALSVGAHLAGELGPAGRRPA